MTALTTYLANAVSATISTANQLYHSGAGSPSTGQPVTTFGTVANFGEILSQGGSAWAASGSIGTPTGHGFFLDDTTLDNQQFVAGSWSATVRLGAQQGGGLGGTITADIYVRVYRYTPSSTTYTQIISMSLTGQTINATLTNYSLSGSTGSATNFASGDKMYVDYWLNIISNTNGTSNQGVRINRLSTDTTNHIGDALASIVTPGFQSGSTTVTKDIAARFRQQSGMLYHDITSRFRQQSGMQNHDLSARFRQQSGGINHDVAGRFRQQSGGLNHDLAARFRQLATTNRDIIGRFRQLAITNRDITGRFRQQSGGVSHDVAARFRLTSALPTATRDIACRFRLAVAPNATLYVRGGEATAYVRGGQATMYVRKE